MPKISTTLTNNSYHQYLKNIYTNSDKKISPKILQKICSPAKLVRHTNFYTNKNLKDKNANTSKQSNKKTQQPVYATTKSGQHKIGDHMKTNIVFYCYHLTSVALLSLFITNQAFSANYTALPHSDNYSILNSLLAMHSIKVPSDDIAINIFEIGGGDPAMNGSLIYICINYHESAFVWRTEINIRSINKITYSPPNSITIRANKDFMDKNYTIKSKNTTYSIQFNTNNSTLSNTIIIENDNVNIETKKKQALD